jgi:hypothetical protein
MRVFFLDHAIEQMRTIDLSYVVSLLDDLKHTDNFESLPNAVYCNDKLAVLSLHSLRVIVAKLEGNSVVLSVVLK